MDYQLANRFLNLSREYICIGLRRIMFSKQKMSKDVGLLEEGIG